MPLIQESSGRKSITIPDSIAILKGWHKGDELQFQEQMGHVTIVKIRNANNK